jgi:hypothetical protein
VRLLEGDRRGAKQGDRGATGGKRGGGERSSLSDQRVTARPCSSMTTRPSPWSRATETKGAVCFELRANSSLCSNTSGRVVEDSDSYGHLHISSLV